MLVAAQDAAFHAWDGGGMRVIFQATGQIFVGCVTVSCGVPVKDDRLGGRCVRTLNIIEEQDTRPASVWTVEKANCFQGGTLHGFRPVVADGGHKLRLAIRWPKKDAAPIACMLRNFGIVRVVAGRIDVEAWNTLTLYDEGLFSIDLQIVG